MNHKPNNVHAPATNAIVFGIDDTKADGYIGWELKFLMELFQKNDVKEYVPELSVYCLSFENPPSNYNHMKERFHVSFRDPKKTVREDILAKAAMKALRNKKVPHATCYKQMVEYTDDYGGIKEGLGLTFRTFDNMVNKNIIVPMDCSNGYYEFDLDTSKDGEDNIIESHKSIGLDIHNKFFEVLDHQLSSLMLLMKTVKPNDV